MKFVCGDISQGLELLGHGHILSTFVLFVWHHVTFVAMKHAFKFNKVRRSKNNL
jgi:hypothetical protein